MAMAIAGTSPATSWRRRQESFRFISSLGPARDAGLSRISTTLPRESTFPSLRAHSPGVERGLLFARTVLVALLCVATLLTGSHRAGLCTLPGACARGCADVAAPRADHSCCSSAAPSSEGALKELVPGGDCACVANPELALTGVRSGLADQVRAVPAPALDTARADATALSLARTNGPARALHPSGPPLFLATAALLI